MVCKSVFCAHDRPSSVRQQIAHKQFCGYELLFRFVSKENRNFVVVALHVSSNMYRVIRCRMLKMHFIQFFLFVSLDWLRVNAQATVIVVCCCSQTTPVQATLTHENQCRENCFWFFFGAPFDQGLVYCRIPVANAT